MSKKIVIVDDHHLVLDGLCSMVEEMDGYKVIGTAGNGKEGLQLIELLSPEIVIMDIDMPIMNGLEATRRIKASSSNAKILILTMHNEVALIKKVMDIGADGYLLKNADREEFVEALSSMSKGKSFFSTAVTQSLLDPQGDRTNNFEISPDSLQLAKLTEREIEVLKFIAEGMSNKEIGEELFISHRTVDSHRTNLMKKLDVHNIAGLIKIAIKNGLVN